MDNWIKPGADVLLVNSSHTAAELVKIVKVYKNGNFTVDGHSSQFRPSGTKTGPGWSKSMVMPATEKNLALWAHQKRIAAAKFRLRAEAGRLQKLASMGSDAELLAWLAAREEKK